MADHWAAGTVVSSACELVESKAVEKAELMVGYWVELSVAWLVG